MSAFREADDPGQRFGLAEVRVVNEAVCLAAYVYVCVHLSCSWPRGLRNASTPLVPMQRHGSSVIGLGVLRARQGNPCALFLKESCFKPTQHASRIFNAAFASMSASRICTEEQSQRGGVLGNISSSDIHACVARKQAQVC